MFEADVSSWNYESKEKELLFTWYLKSSRLGP